MDTGSINSSLWVALGLDPFDLYDIIDDANEAYQDGNDVVYEAIIDALNEEDSGSGDLLDYVIQSSFQASSQSGYVGKISIPDDVWNRVNKASKNGLNIRISNNTIVNLTKEEFWENYCSHSAYPNVNSVGNFSTPCVMYASSSTYATMYQCLTNSLSNSIVYQGQLYFESADQSSSSRANRYYSFSSINSITSGDTINSTLINGKYYFMAANGFNQSLDIISVFGSASATNKHIGVASDFITNKANVTYDVVSKSSTYNPDTGKIEGARSINLITPAYLSQLVASLRDGILSIPEALQRLGIGAIDTDQAIPIGVGFDIDTLSHVVAQSVPQEATAAATREAFQQLDNFTFYTPDDFIGVPSVSPLPVAMNWLAVQMQTMMSLTSFQNCWIVLSTLAVLSLLVGLIRLSK